MAAVSANIPDLMADTAVRYLLYSILFLSFFSFFCGFDILLDSCLQLRFAEREAAAGWSAGCYRDAGDKMFNDVCQNGCVCVCVFV